MFWRKDKEDAPPEDAVTNVLPAGEGGPDDMDPQSKRLEIKKSADERRFLRKLDLFLLTYGCLSQVIKYLVSRQRDPRNMSALTRARTRLTSTRPTSRA